MRFFKKFWTLFSIFSKTISIFSNISKNFTYFCCFLSFLFANKSILLSLLLNLVNLVFINQKRSAIYWLEAVMYANKIPKKWTLKIQKSKIVTLVLKRSSISAVFPIVRFAGDQKTALTGESLYHSAMFCLK